MKIPQRVLSLALLQGLQFEHKFNNHHHHQVSKQNEEHQVQHWGVTPSQPSEEGGMVMEVEEEGEGDDDGGWSWMDEKAMIKVEK